MKQTLWLTLAVTFAGACAQTTPEMQVINDAVEALGGREAIASVNTMVMEGTAHECESWAKIRGRRRTYRRELLLRHQRLQPCCRPGQWASASAADTHQ